jgi:hypothetical protein
MIVPYNQDTYNVKPLDLWSFFFGMQLMGSERLSR